MVAFRLDQQAMLATTAEWIDTAVASSTDDDYGTAHVVPDDLRGFLGRLRLLEGVPFCYLVADSQLLPPESIRFFYLDRAWTDALTQGALSVGTVNSSDRSQLEQLHATIRDDIDAEERRVRLPGSEDVQQGPAGTVTGLLLRSRAVSGWPGLHVRAYRRDLVGDQEVVPESNPDRIKVLRLERLAPAVLLALFDGVPALVHIEEPRQGIQFGVVPGTTASPTVFTATVPARNALDSSDVSPVVSIPVAFRPDAPGVIDLRATAANIVSTPSAHITAPIDAARFALEMLRFPYRQVFGDTDVQQTDVFRVDASYTLDALKISFAAAVEL